MTATARAAVRLIRMTELEKTVGLGASTIYRLIQQGRFPKPLHPLGNKIAAWNSHEVEAWVAERCEGKVA